MKLAARIGLATTLLAAITGGLAFLASGGTGPVKSLRLWQSAVQCKECHQDVYAEWLGSHHQIAYTNPEVRVLSEDFRKEECMDCHLPRPLAVTGFGKRTLPRRSLFDEGVSCISCHLAPDGGILGRNDRPDAPCKPRRSDDFLAVSACESCHNQHATTDQWRASHFAKEGVDCANCHMPEVPRTRQDGSKRLGREHIYRGAHDTPTLKKAEKFTASRDGNDLLLRLDNVGAGHNFPTEERHRAVDMMVRFVRADGSATVWVRAFRHRQPYRDEPGENTQLPAGEHKEVRVSIPDDAVTAEARLWYRLTPFCGDEDPRSTMLEERKVPLR